jgi:hypothetical protein
MYQAIYRKLQETAAAQTTVPYEELMQLAELNPFDRTDWTRLLQLLAQIDRREHRQGRPLLSAVAVSPYVGISGAAFFQQAETLGRYAGGSEPRFWQEERDRVYAAWNRPRPRGLGETLRSLFAGERLQPQNV